MGPSPPHAQPRQTLKPMSVTPSSTSRSSCLSFDSQEQPDGPRTEHQLPAWASPPLRHWGLTIPCRCPGASVPISAFGIETDLGPHRNPNSVLHIVLVPHHCYLLNPVSVILVRTLDFPPLHPHPHDTLLLTPVIKDPPSH